MSSAPSLPLSSSSSPSPSPSLSPSLFDAAIMSLGLAASSVTQGQKPFHRTLRGYDSNSDSYSYVTDGTDDDDDDDDDDDGDAGNDINDINDGNLFYKHLAIVNNNGGYVCVTIDQLAELEEKIEEIEYCIEYCTGHFTRLVSEDKQDVHPALLALQHKQDLQLTLLYQKNLIVWKAQLTVNKLILSLLAKQAEHFELIMLGTPVELDIPAELRDQITQLKRDVLEAVLKRNVVEAELFAGLVLEDAQLIRQTQKRQIVWEKLYPIVQSGYDSDCDYEKQSYDSYSSNSNEGDWSDCGSSVRSDDSDGSAYDEYLEQLAYQARQDTKVDHTYPSYVPPCAEL
jgi:hypothetical protein